MLIDCPHGAEFKSSFFLLSLLDNWNCFGSAMVNFVSCFECRYLPTQSNLQIWKLDGKVKKSLNRIIESRLHLQSSNGKSHYSYGDDLLGVMMDTEKSNAGPKMNMNEIMEECKTFFFTGHETTSNWLTWAVFLLSLHKDWQEKLRQEVLQNCGMEIPDANMLSKLKMV